MQAAVRAVGIRPLEATMREIAAKLQVLVGSRITLYHVSDTRFSFLCCPRGTASEQETFASSLLAAMREPFTAGGISIDLNVQAGLVALTLERSHAADALRKATAAMHESVTRRERLLWHSPRYDVQHRRAYALLRDVPTGLASGQFRLVFQPQFDLASRMYSGVEALARWRHPKYGEISPAEFIPLIESTVLIHEFTAWVVDAALQQLRTWRDDGLDLAVAVNVSSRNLEQPGFVEAVGLACERHGVAPRHLNIECTEHSILTSDATRAALEALRALGIAISLDDFGMGFSNLACLATLPVQVLKLDRSLLTPIATTPHAFELVRNLIRLGQSLGHQVLAEGVEDQATLDLLVDAGCDAIQGFFLSRPLPPTQLRSFIVDAQKPAGPEVQSGLPAQGPTPCLLSNPPIPQAPEATLEAQTTTAT